jgi:hypothetical protein
MVIIELSAPSTVLRSGLAVKQLCRCRNSQGLMHLGVIHQTAQPLLKLDANESSAR